MESNGETEASIVSLLLVKKKKTRNRSVCVKSCLERRTNQGLYGTLAQELRFEDELEYIKLLLMTSQDFHKILGLV